MKEENIKIKIGNWIGIEAQSPSIFSLLIVLIIAIFLYTQYLKPKDESQKRPRQSEAF